MWELEGTGGGDGGLKTKTGYNKIKDTVQVSGVQVLLTDFLTGNAWRTAKIMLGQNVKLQEPKSLFMSHDTLCLRRTGKGTDQEGRILGCR